MTKVNIVIGNIFINNNRVGMVATAKCRAGRELVERGCVIRYHECNKLLTAYNLVKFKITLNRTVYSLTNRTGQFSYGFAYNLITIQQYVRLDTTPSVCHVTGSITAYRRATCPDYCYY